MNPGWGDAVQAAKAGLLEIADVFVVNKADRPGAPETVRDLDGMLELAGDTGWRPPVVCTTATSGAGIDELWAAIGAHRAHLEATGGDEARRRERLRAEIRTIVAERLLERAAGATRGDGFDALLDEVVARHPQSVRRRGRAPRRCVTRAHTRSRVLEAAAAGRFPDPDGRIDVFPALPGPADGLFGFTAHFAVAVPIPPAEVLARVPPGNFSFPMSAPFVTWIAERIGARPGVLDAVLSRAAAGWACRRGSSPNRMPTTPASPGPGASAMTSPCSAPTSRTACSSSAAACAGVGRWPSRSSRPLATADSAGA